MFYSIFRKLFFLFFLSLATIQAKAAILEKSSATLPNGLIVHEFVLKNGLQLLLVPDNSAPVITYQVWVKTGAATERLDPKLKKTGLAHLFEHMMFRGTPKNPADSFDKKLTTAGVEGENATTAEDRTNFFESLPKEYLELAFELESDRMKNLSIKEDIFKTELGAVLGELKMNLDRPNALAWYTLNETAFEKSPYHDRVIGLEKIVKNFTVDEANYFFHTYYAPNNATVIVIGDFDIPAAVRLADKYYGDMKPKTLPAINVPEEPEQKALRKVTKSHPMASQELLMLGYKIPQATHNDIPALELLGSTLSTGHGSLLEQHLVDGGIASSVEAGPNKHRFPNLFIIEANLRNGKSVDTALKEIRRCLQMIQSNKFTEKDLSRAKNQLLLSTYESLSSQEAIGDYLGDAIVTADDYMHEFNIMDKVKSVSLADLRRVALKYFTDKNTSIVVIKPEHKPKKLG